jgi:hypothetical protein
MEEDVKSADTTGSLSGQPPPRVRETRKKAPESTNSIRQSRRRTRAIAEPEEPRKSNGPEGANSAKVGDAHARLIPDHIRKRFVQRGHAYHFPDGAHAFTDLGARLVTPSENAEVVKSLIGIAEARGWKEITVSGSERFRRQAWAAASELRLTVRGYTPTEFDVARESRKADRDALAVEGAAEPSAPYESRPKGARVASGSDRSTSLITGRLIDHGVATYRHDPREPLSYFVKVQTPEGEREIWGIDLKRALKESLTQPKIGDSVGLRALRREAVTVREGEKPLAAHRNRWIVEGRQFFENRAAAASILRDPTIDPKQAARQHPELIGTYLQMHAAQIAARQFKNSDDQAMFVSRVRAALADRVASGEALPVVRIKEKSAVRAPDPARTEEAPTR